MIFNLRFLITELEWMDQMARAFRHEWFPLRFKFHESVSRIRRRPCGLGKNGLPSLGMAALRSDLGGGYEFTVIAPRAALVVDDVR
jgi:hypothetical protein